MTMSYHEIRTEISNAITDQEARIQELRADIDKRKAEIKEINSEIRKLRTMRGKVEAGPASVSPPEVPGSDIPC